jgi:cobalt-zinc-cadmium efflux system protein
VTSAPRAAADAHAPHSHADHDHRPSSTRTLAVAVALTLGFAFVELIAGFATGSLALLADAGHMVTDSAALLFALAAHLVSRRPVTDRHSYGLARVEVIAAFVNALAMLAVVVWIGIEAVDRLRHPVPVQGPGVMAVAAIGLAINVLVAWTLSRDRGNVNTRAALVHVMGDLLGSLAAIVAGVVITFGGPVLVDPLLSLFVAALILRSTFGVLRETVLVLMDSVPPGLDYGSVGRALAGVPGVLTVSDLHVWTIAPGRNALSAHLLVAEAGEWPGVLLRARRALAHFDIDHVTLQPQWLRAAPERVIPVVREGG